MIKGVIFDMDGLMFDTERLATNMWQEVAKRLNIDLTYERIMMFKGSNKQYKRELFKEWFGSENLYEKAQNLRDTLMDEYIYKNGVPVKKGLFNLLEAMKSENIKMAIATSTNREKANYLWESSGVAKYIDASVCGDEVKKSKPNPEIFNIAMDKLGLEPDDCIILEDSPNGIEAGYLSGAKTIMIPDTIAPTQKEKKFATYILDSLDDVIKFLK